MALGDRQHQVTLDTTDGAGGVMPLDPATWYCAARSEGGTEVAFTGEYHQGISTVTRVHFKGRTYHVTTIENRDERDRELLLHCTEVLDA
jgi:head-tail adaptor